MEKFLHISEKNIEKLNILSWFALLAMLAYDICLLNEYAFDLPFWDVWDNLPRGNLENIFNFYNENLQLFYNIISEIMYWCSDWNLRYFAFVNFAIYLGILMTYISIIRASQIKIMMYPLFFLPMLSPILGYNWLWSILVQTHTYILFFLLAVYCGFCTEKNKIFLFTVCLILSVLSMNFPLSLGLLAVYIAKEILGVSPQIKKETIRNIIIPLLVYGVLFAYIWFKKDSQSLKDVKLDNVFSKNYISNLSFYIVEGLSLFSLTDVLSVQVCLPLFILLLIFLSIAFSEQYKNKKFQALWAIVFSVMFNICSVVALRHGEVHSYNIGFIRHHETLFLLFPAILILLLSSRFSIVKLFGILILCQMLYGLGVTVKEKRFQFFGELFYKNACFCLNHYYNLKTISDWKCTMNYPIPVDDKIEYAKEHNLSFIKNIAKCNN